LEARFPGNETFTPEQKALLRLFERWTSDAGVFTRAVQLIPTNLPAMQDPKFRKDREELSGRPFTIEAFQKLRPESLAHIRDAFELLETSLLADGRNWIFNTEKPSLGDSEG
jgi:hypothetical protein